MGKNINEKEITSIRNLLKLLGVKDKKLEEHLKIISKREITSMEENMDKVKKLINDFYENLQAEGSRLRAVKTEYEYNIIRKVLVDFANLKWGKDLDGKDLNKEDLYDLVIGLKKAVANLSSEISKSTLFSNKIKGIIKNINKQLKAIPASSLEDEFNNIEKLIYELRAKRNNNKAEKLENAFKNICQLYVKPTHASRFKRGSKFFELSKRIEEAYEKDCKRMSKKEIKELIKNKLTSIEDRAQNGKFAPLKVMPTISLEDELNNIEKLIYELRANGNNNKAEKLENAFKNICQLYVKPTHAPRFKRGSKFFELSKRIEEAYEKDCKRMSEKEIQELIKNKLTSIEDREKNMKEVKELIEDFSNAMVTEQKRLSALGRKQECSTIKENISILKKINKDENLDTLVINLDSAITYFASNITENRSFSNYIKDALKAMLKKIKALIARVKVTEPSLSSTRKNFNKQFIHLLRHAKQVQLSGYGYERKNSGKNKRKS